MPDDPSTHGLAMRNTGQSIDSSVPFAQDQTVNVVCVEPHRSDLPGRATLLAGTLYQVTTVTDIGELILLRDQEPVAVALLSALLGDSALVAAARMVRRQWPRARIVVLGQAALILDDHLYDEAISHNCEQQVLLDTLKRLTHNPWTEKPDGRLFVVPAANYENVPIRQAHPFPTANAGSSDATQDSAEIKGKA